MRPAGVIPGRGSLLFEVSMEFLKLLEGLRTPVLDHVMSVITQLGGETIFMLAAMVAYWCYDKAFGYYMMSVGFTGTALNQF